MNRKGNIRRLFLHGERKRILRLLKICFRKADWAYPFIGLMFLHAAQQIEQAGGDCGPDKAGQQRQQQSAQRKP